MVIKQFQDIFLFVNLTLKGKILIIAHLPWNILFINQYLFELSLINNNICAVCKEGYYGISCKLKCRFPSYGLACQQKCICMEKDCDHIKGCLLSAKGKLSIKADMLPIHLKGH